MKITLPNGIVIESEGAVEVDGVRVAPVLDEEEAEDFENDEELYEDSEEESDEGEDEEEEPPIAGRLHKSCRYPTEVASLSKANRDAYKVLARYDNEQGVHYGQVSRELGITMAAAWGRCWSLWRKQELAERVGPGRFRAVLIR